MDLIHLNNRHAGETILLCGTGPSIDTTDWSRAPRIRVCINHAIAVVPLTGINYFVALDRETIIEMGGIPAPDGPADHVIPVLPRTMPKLLGDVAPGINGDWHRCVFFELESERIIADRAEAADLGTLYNCYGTATPAAYLAWFLGAARVLTVGLDGTAGYAEGVLSACEGKENAGRYHGHRTAVQSAHRVLRVLGVPYDKFTTPNTEKEEQ